MLSIVASVAMAPPGRFWLPLNHPLLPMVWLMVMLVITIWILIRQVRGR